MANKFSLCAPVKFHFLSQKFSIQFSFFQSEMLLREQETISKAWGFGWSNITKSCWPLKQSTIVRIMFMFTPCKRCRFPTYLYRIWWPIHYQYSFTASLICAALTFAKPVGGNGNQAKMWPRRGWLRQHLRRHSKCLRPCRQPRVAILQAAVTLNSDRWQLNQTLCKFMLGT